MTCRLLQHQAIPLVGRFYTSVFRKGFSYGFLAASALCRRARGSATRP